MTQVSEIDIVKRHGRLAYDALELRKAHSGVDFLWIHHLTKPFRGTSLPGVIAFERQLLDSPCEGDEAGRTNRQFMELILADIIDGMLTQLNHAEAGQEALDLCLTTIAAFILPEERFMKLRAYRQTDKEAQQTLPKFDNDSFVTYGGFLLDRCFPNFDFISLVFEKPSIGSGPTLATTFVGYVFDPETGLFTVKTI